MMHAYDKMYLEKARTCLARMLDFAVYDLQYPLAEFYALFLSSGVAYQFGSGDEAVIVGKSGVELAYEVLERSNMPYERIKPNYTMNRSEEYWTGWALAYYQWETSLTFLEIEKALPIQEICAMYMPYHEMDIRQFCDRMNALYRKVNPNTKLKQLRMRAKISQQQLADYAGISVRTIQQYEQRQKNINKAQGETLVMLARELCCRVEDLLEKVSSE